MTTINGVKHAITIEAGAGPAPRMRTRCACGWVSDLAPSPAEAEALGAVHVSRTAREHAAVVREGIEAPLGVAGSAQRSRAAGTLSDDDEVSSPGGRSGEELADAVDELVEAREAVEADAAAEAAATQLLGELPRPAWATDGALDVDANVEHGAEVLVMYQRVGPNVATPNGVTSAVLSRVDRVRVELHSRKMALITGTPTVSLSDFEDVPVDQVRELAQGLLELVETYESSAS